MRRARRGGRRARVGLGAVREHRGRVARASHVGEPDGAAERILRIGSGVLSLWAGGLLVLRTRPRGWRESV